MEYFEYESYKKVDKEITISLVEKNLGPKIPEEYGDRKIQQKGFKDITIDDFPLRGNKIMLRLRRRVWQTHGQSKTFKREIEVNYSWTKLEKTLQFFYGRRLR